jgi:hypothetical protein
MSSLFPVAEVELGRLALAAVTGSELDVVVGGLGLGYTARAVVSDPRVRSLHVVEALEAVIGWHERGLLPMAAQLTDDTRCRLVHGDFFALAESGFGPDAPERWHAIVVDIDHTPSHLLQPQPCRLLHGCRPAPGRRPAAPRRLLRAVVRRAAGRGLRGLLDDVFEQAAAHVVEFPTTTPGACRPTRSTSRPSPGEHPRGSPGSDRVRSGQS